MKAKIFFGVLILWVFINNSCKKEKLVVTDDSNVEFASNEPVNAEIRFGISSYKTSNGWYYAFGGYAAFFKDKYPIGMPVNVGDLIMGSEKYLNQSGVGGTIYDFDGSKPAKIANWGKEVELSFGGNLDAGYKPSRTKIYLPKALTFSNNLTSDTNFLYSYNSGSSLELNWTIDSKIDSALVDLSYDGITNHDNDSTLSDKDKYIQFNVLNNGALTVPLDSLNVFKKGSELGIGFLIKSVKKVNLNGKVILVDCSSVAGFRMKIK